jgi:hypothetical protein
MQPAVLGVRLLVDSPIGWAGDRLGEAAPASVSISRDLLIDRFWKNLHLRLQPAVPKGRTKCRQEVVQRLLFDTRPLERP